MPFGETERGAEVGIRMGAMLAAEAIGRAGLASAARFLDESAELMGLIKEAAERHLCKPLGLEITPQDIDRSNCSEGFLELVCTVSRSCTEIVRLANRVDT